jgi:LmbE family N-acetylglucosaminyl deacetylase
VAADVARIGAGGEIMITSLSDVGAFGTVLGIWAHPDDEAYLSGGLMAVARDNGQRVVCVTATRGERGTAGDPPLCTPDELPARRERELREAAGIIGFDELHLLGYRDRELAGAPRDEVRRALVRLIRRFRPDVIVTFDPHGFNEHPDHIAISRFTTDAIAAAADGRWEADAGEAHCVTRLLWTPPIGPWDAVNTPRLDAHPGVDFVVDVSPWRERRVAALRAHRTQHRSIEKYFLSRPDADRILGIDVWRQAFGPPVARRPSPDIFEGIGETGGGASA